MHPFSVNNSAGIPIGILEEFLNNADGIRKIVKKIEKKTRPAIWAVKFSREGDTKLERFLPKNQHNQRKGLNFENWCNGKVSKSAKI